MSVQKININPQLNESYTFDSFVEGECNRLARSAGYAVSQNPGGTSFNRPTDFQAAPEGKGIESREASTVKMLSGQGVSVYERDKKGQLVQAGGDCQARLQDDEKEDKDGG